MNPEQQLQSIEISIEQAKEAISMAEALDRLHKNPDFQKVIREGWQELAGLAARSGSRASSWPRREEG